MRGPRTWRLHMTRVTTRTGQRQNSRSVTFVADTFRAAVGQARYICERSQRETPGEYEIVSLVCDSHHPSKWHETAEEGVGPIWPEDKSDA